jgi:apolipoprotein N-acyltransferase
LRKLNFKSIGWLRYLLALLGGFLLAFAFPNMGVAGFAWIAPAIILASAFGTTGWQSFRLGYVAGLAHFLTSIYWLLYIPFPVGAVAAWIALNLYLALYPAIWVWLCMRLAQRRFSNSAGSLRDHFLQSTWLDRTVWSVAAGVTWVGLEMVRARFLSGFPWNFLANSQYKLVPLIQIASIAGVYGVGFLIVWFSASLLSLGLVFLDKPSDRRRWLSEILFPAAVVAAVFAWGTDRLNKAARPYRELKVATIQPSIPQRLIFDPNETPFRFQKLIDLSTQALEEKPHLLVWPEAALPGLTKENFSVISKLIATHKVSMILGADDVEVTPKETNYYNSCFLLGPDGNFLETYRKRRLVIFGEYVPLEKWLPFVKYLTPIEGSFAMGKGPVPFELLEPHANISPLICFEDVFPHYAREHVADDTDILLNLTNDGWFGNSAAQKQQGMNAVFRAVENGVPLVRCTNNGLTCWVDENGRVREVFKDTDGTIYGEGYLVSKIALRSSMQKKSPTFYNRHGDWFGWGCVGLGALLLVGSLRRRSPSSTAVPAC